MRSLALAAVAVAAVPTSAHAFCGFYVGGAGVTLTNPATEVVLMRVGTRTVLSMQNHYEGPPEHFAMVVPVPAVLHDGDVKTLPPELFAKIDAMSAPRLVEYWEQDPCYEEPHESGRRYMSAAAPPTPTAAAPGYGVSVEARFAVGEYDVAILSARESTGLDAYLRDQRYEIPAGAEPLLRPYVEAGMKFFVAKVDPSRVHFVDGRALLSPLRFHYDSDEFALPIRLGLANSAGTQDLIVNVLAPERYEVANYPDVTIPTNLEVKDEVRTRFGEFYAALFDRTIEKNPRAVVTEYSWQATTCDPCPGPTLDTGDLQTLGGDVVAAPTEGLTLTRLHARYGKDGAPEDLVFRTAQGITGGREDSVGNGATAAASNDFQGRYIIHHPWTGAITCRHPQRGRWGGPPDGDRRAMKLATDAALAPRGQIALDQVVAQEVPALDVHGVPVPGGAALGVQQGCACHSFGNDSGDLPVLGGMLAVALRSRGRRRRSIPSSP